MTRSIYALLKSPPWPQRLEYSLFQLPSSDQARAPWSLHCFEYSLLEACQILHGHITGTHGGLTDADAAKLHQAISERIEAWTLSIRQSKAFDGAVLALCQAVVAEYEGRDL